MSMFFLHARFPFLVDCPSCVGAPRADLVGFFASLLDAFCTVIVVMSRESYQRDMSFPSCHTFHI